MSCEDDFTIQWHLSMHFLSITFFVISNYHIILYCRILCLFLNADNDCWFVNSMFVFGRKWKFLIFRLGFDCLKIYEFWGEIVIVGGGFMLGWLGRLMCPRHKRFLTFFYMIVCLFLARSLDCCKNLTLF